ncbi:MAG: 50S ribosomal protein L29 [Candidatus Pacebacteria bacterium]|nr:50S ribosomal protein L29 [Candidatus Paceibacterota bacterium]
MKTKGLRQKDVKDLRKLERELREKLRQLRFDLASGKVKNVREIRKVKKDIARILTIIREKEKG